MFNRLTRSVFAIGILLLGNSSTFSAIPDGMRAAQPLPTSNPSALLFGQDEPLPWLTEKLIKEVVTEPVNLTGATLTKSFVPSFTCVDQDNTDNLTPWVGLSFRNSGALGGIVTAIGNKYLVQDNFLCSLNGTWMFFGEISGSIDGVIGIWAGAGPNSSVPSSQVASVIVNSTALTANSWNFVDLSGFGLTFTENFFISFGSVLGSAVDAAGPETDRIQATLDNSDGSAVTPRTGITFDATFSSWTQNNLFWTQYHNQVASASVCCEEIPFSNCLLRTHVDALDANFVVTSVGSCKAGLAMRYTTGGFDTLVSAEINLNDLGGVQPNGQVIIELLADNGSGLPDPSAPLAPPLVVGGAGLGAELYPLGSTGWIDYPLGNLVPGPSVTYHIAVRYIGPDPDVAGIGTSIFAELDGDVQNFASVWFPDGVIQPEYVCGLANPSAPKGWKNYFGTFGVSRDFLIDINVCHDEFIDCELSKNAGNLTSFSDFHASDGYTGFSGSYLGFADCRVDIARIPVFGYDDLDGMEVGIYLDAGGSPGAVVYSEIVPQASFPFGNGLSQGNAFIDIFPNAGAGVQISGSYHVVAKPLYGSISADPAYQILMSDGSDPVASHFESGGIWLPSDAVFINGNNFYTESFRCCVPFVSRECTPGDDWPTYQHDQQRTGRSTTTLREAHCNLNLLWSVTSDAGNAFSGSVIFDNKVLVSDDYGVDCRSLSTGALIWDQNTHPTVSGLFAGTVSNRTQPTVATIIINGGPVQVAFLGTGLNRDVVAVSAQTGAYIWHNTTNSPFPGLAPNATNVKSIILNDGVDDILFYATGKKVYAVLAATGLPYPFWAVNPFVMAADNANALTTNDAGFGNSQIVVPTYSGSIEGDVYSLDASSGALNWNLASIGGAGLQSSRDALAGNLGNEGFFSGASYDRTYDVFWVNSYFDADFPAEGYLYRIAADGSTFSTEKSVRSRRATPIIGSNQIYVPAFAKWPNPIHSGEQIFLASTGKFIGNMEGSIAGDRQFNDGVLSCALSEEKYYIHGTELGELNFYRVGVTNSFEFNRRTTLSGFVGGQWAGGSLSDDAVVFTTLGGLTVALGSGVNRSRLTLPATRQELPIPFGTPSGFEAVFPSVIGNKGCFDLVINGITFTAPTPPSATPIEFVSVNPSLRAKMNELATFTTNSRLFEKMNLMYGESPIGLGAFDSYASPDANSRVSSKLNFRAAILPDVVDGTIGAGGLISPSAGERIAPGSIVDLHVAINGPLVTRGPHDFTAHVDTDDPDYFLDDPSAIPTIALRVIGGCLEDSVNLTFGIGGANSVLVFNDALVQRFNTDGNSSLNIDGFASGTEFFAGIRGWSLTPHRMAWTGSAWGFIGGWRTIFGDPNYCGNTCVPTLNSDVLLGSISTDKGATYTSVYGDLVGLTYLDSAQDYGVPWDWESNPDEFLPDSTIGIVVNESHYGAKDILGLANFQLVRLDVTNRSATNPITDLQHFAVHDDDINGVRDIMIGSETYGYIFGELGSSVSVHGYGVVGYGCDVAPNFRGRTCAADQFMFNTELDPGPFDSIYIWGRAPEFAGITSQVDLLGGDPYTADGESYYNFGGVDLAPNETKSIGFFHFAFTGTSDPSVYDGNPQNPAQFEELADLANKWAGFGRGDVNNDQSIDLADVVYLAGSVNGGNGAYPFAHLADVNNDGLIDAADVAYLKDYYFNCGPCPVNDWSLALCTP